MRIYWPHGEDNLLVWSCFPITSIKPHQKFMGEVRKEVSRQDIQLVWGNIDDDIFHKLKESDIVIFSKLFYNDLQ